MGYDATRAEEYYRTSFPNSSPKFCWLNVKPAKAPKNGAGRLQFQNLSPTARPWTLKTLPDWHSPFLTSQTEACLPDTLPELPD